MGIKYKVNEDFFKVWTPKMAYVLGFVTADGSLEDASYLRGKYLRVCSSDIGILEKIKTAMHSEHKIVILKPKQILIRGKRYLSKERYMLRIGDHEIYNDLIQLGITPRKSKTIVLPSVASEFIAYFLRGYLDGDGCINLYDRKQRLSVTFTSGSKIFLEELSKIIGLLLNIKIHNVFRNNNAFQLKYSTREAVSLLKYIYSDTADKLYLQRKYCEFLNFLQLYPKWREFNGVVPKWRRELSAKQLFTGSNPVHASLN